MQRIVNIINPLLKEATDHRFELLETLMHVKEYVLCWEILIDWMSNRDDDLLINLFEKKNEIIAIAKELNLDNTYIKIVASHGLKHINSLMLDLSNIKEYDEMHERLKDAFGFPSFCGKNGNAYIDCLTSLRYPENEMLGIYLESKEVLDITLKTENLNKKFLQNLLEVFKCVNARYEEAGDIAPIKVSHSLT